MRREITKRGGQRPCLRIARKLFVALSDPAGVIAHRPGALERVQLLLEDWTENERKLTDTEARMTAVLGELELTELVPSISGISAVGAAAILAETGDPNRFSPRGRWSSTPASPHGRSCRAPSPVAPGSPDKAGHGCGSRPGEPSGGLCRPTPSTPPGTATSPRGRPTSSPPPQAQTVIVAAILRHLHAVITSGVAWDPVLATHGMRRKANNVIAAWDQQSGSKRTVGASPTRH